MRYSETDQHPEIRLVKQKYPGDANHKAATRSQPRIKRTAHHIVFDKISR
jgi:hypothetical protein